MRLYEFYLTGSLTKVFPHRRPQPLSGDIFNLSGEIPAFQLVYHRSRSRRTDALPSITFTCRADGIPGQARIRFVELIPSAFPCRGETDENYLTRNPGLFPDLLKPCPDGCFTPLTGQYRALWIDFPSMKEAPAGKYPVTLTIEGHTDTGVITSTLSVTIEQASLPGKGQTPYHTQWFHADCLADYYRTPVFSEFHWQSITSQIRMAAELGINTILAPVFTPPLDTQVGGERTTVQLVDISLTGGSYHFRFEKLDRFCRICRDAGIPCLEIPHLFTQWGAHATPKILVAENGAAVKKFGWHIPADAPEYRMFLEAFLPALTNHLLSLGYDREHVFFHISDEPGENQIEHYQKARAMAAGLLEGWQIIDAVSDYCFYEQGLLSCPVVAENYVDEFAGHGVTGLWTYYCCSQTREVPNRFFAMPSARSRVLGVLMYLYKIRGFLHWGYNFYNSALSLAHIDPFFDTHASYTFPSGDSFLVYPGTDGVCWSSLRGEVMRQVMEDYQALTALEEAAGRERVLALIREDWDKPFTFRSYPVDDSYFYRLRRKIAEECRRISQIRQQ